MTIDAGGHTTLPLMRLAMSSCSTTEAATRRLGVPLGKRIQLGQVALNLQLLVELIVQLTFALDCLAPFAALNVFLDVYRGALLLAKANTGDYFVACGR